MYAMKLNPAVKDYIWGGDNLKKYWNKKSDKDVIAEAWELSCHKEGESIIANGEYIAKTLSSVLSIHPEYIGKNGAKFPFFPVLIKLIDAKENLSIQVHPSDEYALKNEGQFGKSEMWYVVDAAKDSFLYCGFKKEYTLDEVKYALNNGIILDLLNKIQVKKGDAIYIPAGTVHAICGGLLIYEVQQNSSLTYRLFDYNRVDKNGNKRQLHIDKALNVIDTKKVCKVNSEVEKINESVNLLAKCKYFTTYEITVNQSFSNSITEDSFVVLTCVDGEGSISFLDKEEPIKKGDTYFIPACKNQYKLSGKLKVIESRI